MRLGMVTAVLLGGLALGGGPAEARVMERACLQGTRSAPAPLCRCIQRVADATLARSEQRLAASFFRDPHRAQEIRQSPSPRHSAFWKRYRYFGATAELNCR